MVGSSGPGAAIKLAILLLSLGLDTFAVAVSLGLSGMTERERIRYGLAFATAEGIMPVVGVLAGAVIAGYAGGTATFVAALLLAGLGLYTIREALEEERSEMRATGILALTGTALAVSLDELAVGFSLGLVHVPLLLAVLLIAGQAFLLTLIGSAIGQRVGAAMGARAELLAGVVLLLLGLALFAERLHGT